MRADTSGLVGADEARSILAGSWGCDLAHAVELTRADLGPASPATATSRAHACASEALEAVERLARTVVMLRLERVYSTATATAASEELALHRADLAAAAGELMVPIPAPGSESAKLMRANRILRGMNDELHREVRDLRDRVAALTGEKL